MNESATYLTKAEAKAVFGPMLEVAIKAAALGSVAPSDDPEERKQVWEDFSSTASKLIDTLKRLDLLDEAA